MVRLRNIPEVALLVARIPSHESAPLEIPAMHPPHRPQLHCTALCKRTWRKACTLSALCWSWGKFDAFWVQHSTIRIFQDEKATSSSVITLPINIGLSQFRSHCWQIKVSLCSLLSYSRWTKYSNPAARAILNPRTPKSQCFSARVSKSDVRGLIFFVHWG